MQTLQISDSFTASVRKQEFKVEGIQSWPQASIQKVWEYGLQRIFNDAAASAEDKAEALALAGQKLDNLKSGILRASPNRVGDPVKAEALKLVTPKIMEASAFKAWLVKAGLKMADKAARDEVRKLALQAIEQNEGVNQWITQAMHNVEASKGLELDIELDL